MYGNRARIGLLVPSTNTTIEMEFHHMVPQGISVHSTRLYQEETDDPAEKVKTILGMHERLEAGTHELASLGPSVIAYGCTAGSFLSGVAEDQEMCARLGAQAGVPFVTTSTAVAEVLRHMNIRRISMATPYIDAVNQHEKEYLAEAAGVDVLAMKGLGLVGNLPKGRLEPEVASELAHAVDRPDAEAIFISCTNLRTIEIIAPLERSLGKPVITSNQATLWSALRRARYADPIHGYGQLLMQP
jgi:maleate isomerase